MSLELHTSADPRVLSFLERFEAFAVHSPDKVALIDTHRQISYGRLARDIREIASKLPVFTGVNFPRVAIALPRSAEGVILALATLKAGGCFLPLDLSQPVGRLCGYLDVFRPDLLVVSAEDELRDLQTSACRSVSMNGLRTADCIITPSQTVNFPDTEASWAYVLFTSGSTGVPKGAAVSRRALNNFVSWISSQYGSTHDVWLTINSCAFDGYLVETMTPLASGATCVVAAQRLGELESLVTLITEYRITHLALTPATWPIYGYELNKKRTESVRFMVMGGEPLSAAHVADICARTPAQVLNVYGPVEACVFCATHLVMPGEDPVPIGKAIDGVQITVCDESFAVVPIDTAGTIYVSGEGLAAGYLTDPKLTAARFVPNPHAAVPGSRMYNTGDRARVGADGLLYFLGRTDDQVKISGARVELGEIETCVRQIPGVRDAVVATQKRGQGLDLVAFLVAHDLPPTLDAIKTHVAKVLPLYMRPTQYIYVDAIPLTASGKIDRPALIASNDAVSRQDHEEVLTPLQHQIIGVWREVLGHDEIILDSNFFEVGGRSLRVLEVLARTRDVVGVHLGYADFMNHATPRMAAQLCAVNVVQQTLPSVSFLSGERFPLSFQQLWVWYLEQVTPGLRAYEAHALIHIRGVLDVDRLVAAFRDVVVADIIFRMRYCAENGLAFQVIDEIPSISVPVVQLDSEDPSQLAQAMWVYKNDGFQPEQPPLIRWTIFRRTSELYTIFHREHHYVHDGVSANELLRRVFNHYAHGQDPGASHHYLDYVRWQHAWIETDAAKKQLEYWCRHLRDAQFELALPFDSPRAGLDDVQGRQWRVTFPESLCRQVQAMANATGVTLYSACLAGLYLVLRRVCNQEDINIGSAVSARTRPEFAHTLGMMVNTVVYRLRGRGEQCFRTFAREVQQLSLEALAHQDIPFGKVVEAINPPRSIGMNPIYQVDFSFHDSSPAPTENLGFAVQYELPLDTGYSKLDLGFVLIPAYDAAGDLVGAELVCEYSKTLWREDSVARLCARFMQVLASVSENSEQLLESVPVLLPDELSNLIHNGRGKTQKIDRMGWLQHLNVLQAAQPNTPAIVSPEQSLTYADFYNEVRDLSSRLCSSAFPNCRWVLVLDDGCRQILASWALLAAGQTFVPVDPEQANIRLPQILREFDFAFVLTDVDIQDTHLGAQHKLVTWSALRNMEVRTPNFEYDEGHDAYVLFTSGTSGQPKGVVVSSSALHEQISSYPEWTRVGRSDVYVQSSSFSFDVSIFENVVSLFLGATIVTSLSSQRRDVRTLTEKIATHSATFWNTTPQQLDVALESPERLQSLRTVLCGGEAMPPQLAQRFRQHLPHVHLVNSYGPTETCIDAVMWPCAEVTTHMVPIGRPMPNKILMVLDQHGQYCPIGTAGELFLGGAGLANGYLSNPALTAERFVVRRFGDGEWLRCYATGDIVRWRADFMLEFVGRRDTQVKLRGLRIELGEVEAQIATIPGVRTALVRPLIYRGQAQALVAYVIGSAEVQAYNTEDWQTLLASKLLQSSIPSTFFVLDAFPVSPNGKTDFRQLPLPAERTQKTEGHADEHLSIDELKLLEIWRQTLQQPDLGMDDDFFSVGGHSLTIGRILAQIEKLFGVVLPYRIFLQATTVRELSREITRSRNLESVQHEYKNAKS